MKPLKTPFTANELAVLLNENFTEMDMNKVDTSVLDTLATLAMLNRILEGTDVVGKARTLDPDPTPPANQYFGTSPSGHLGWQDLPDPTDPTPLYREAFTENDSRWSGPVNGVHTLSFLHEGHYPTVVFRQTNVNEFISISADVVKDATHIRIRTNERFTGYIVMG